MLRFLDNVAADIQFAFRHFRQSPTFVAAAVLTIALGIGANTAFFALLYGLLLRPLPVSDPGSFYNVHVATRGEGNRSHSGTQYFVSWDEFRHMRKSSKTAEIAGVVQGRMSWREQTDRKLYVQLVTDNLLPLLGAKPVLGRLITASEANTPNAGQVVVLSNKFWKAHMGSALDVIGRTMVLNRESFTIVGVADESTTGPLFTVPDLWIPITMHKLVRPDADFMQNPNMAFIALFGRKKPQFSLDQMKAEMSVVAQQALLPHLPKRRALVTVEPGAFLNYPMIKEKGAPIFAILFGAVTLVLLVACANVANLMLARGVSRRRELAVRLSIGAGKARLLQQLFTEALLLSIAGGLVGLLLAQALGNGALSFIPTSETGPVQISASVDRNIFLYTMALSAVTALLFGLLPAWSTLRADLSPALKSEGLVAPARRRGWLQGGWVQGGLVSAQVAVSLLLLVNAGLLLRSLRQAFVQDVGQATKNVLVATFDLQQNQYDGEKAAQFAHNLRENLLGASQVKAVSMTELSPFNDYCNSPVALVAADGSRTESMMHACEAVGPGYLETMKIPLRQGRFITKADTLSRAKVAVIDENLARIYGKGGSVIGRRIELHMGERETFDIVGVTAATKNLSFGREKEPKIYTPMRDGRFTRAHLLVSYDGPKAPVMETIRQRTAALDPALIVEIASIENNYRIAMLPIEMGATAASALGSFALLLACTGVYGVMAFAVSRRTREIGIRVALGAERQDVAALILGQGLRPVLIGMVIGLGLAALSSQVVKALLIGVSPFDPVAFTGTATLLAAVALLASWVPTRNALAVEPTVALRHE
jgi:macrolide transport system ATP-binding/permease protein